MVIALLTAAGIGSRMHLSVPKQFIHIEDKPLIVYTMEAFENHPSIDAILVVTLPGWVGVLESYAEKYQITKLKWVTIGGDSGQESIYKGLMFLKDKLNDDDVIMIHDGNRCMVSSEIISDSIATYSQCGSAVAVVPCVEAVFRSDNGGYSANIQIPREQLFRTQTPHTYRYKDVLDAHLKAREIGIENAAATCSIMQQLGHEIYFSKGSETNIKITTTDDLLIFEALLNIKKKGSMK